LGVSPLDARGRCYEEGTVSNIGSESQPLIPTGEQSGLLTRIATMDTGSVYIVDEMLTGVSRTGSSNARACERIESS